MLGCLLGVLRVRQNHHGGHELWYYKAARVRLAPHIRCLRLSSTLLGCSLSRSSRATACALVSGIMLRGTLHLASARPYFCTYRTRTRRQDLTCNHQPLYFVGYGGLKGVEVSTLI